jgi:hypothetical protein
MEFVVISKVIFQIPNPNTKRHKVIQLSRWSVMPILALTMSQLLHASTTIHYNHNPPYLGHVLNAVIQCFVLLQYFSFLGGFYFCEL